MKKFLDWLKSAFDTQTVGGASARKLSAFVIMTCVLAIHVAWVKYAFTHEDFSLMDGLLIIDYGFVASLLGMTTYQYLKENKKVEPTPEKKDE